MVTSGERAGLGGIIDRGTLKVVLVILSVAIVIGAITWLSCHDFAIVFGVLGVFAIVLAAIQFADARHTLKNIKGVSANLSASTKRLERQLSTRWVGVFPDFMPQIVDLIGSAKSSVVIFCDFPAYGEFTKPDAYEKYAEVIRKQSERLERVDLLCLDEDKRRELVGQQVSTGGGWESWRSEHEDHLHDYFTAREVDADPKTVTHQELVDILTAGDTRALADEFSAAKTWTTSQVMPLYFWIVDDERAIFTLAPFVQETALEVGFRTIDGNLIGALSGIFNRYWEVESQAEPQPQGAVQLP